MPFDDTIDTNGGFRIRLDDKDVARDVRIVRRLNWALPPNGFVDLYHKTARVSHKGQRAYLLVCFYFDAFWHVVPVPIRRSIARDVVLLLTIRENVTGEADHFVVL